MHKKVALIEQENVESTRTFGPPTLVGFEVDLQNFTGPFDLLLQLVARRDLDLTEVALAEVTEEFLIFIRTYPNLSSATDFLVVAATLLEMKAAALLPKTPGQEPVGQDLEARDLLFSRLLQYSAFKDAAKVMQNRWKQYGGAVARKVPLEQPFASMMPKLQWTLSCHQLALLAHTALKTKLRPDMADHVARPTVSLDNVLQDITRCLKFGGESSFGELILGAPTLEVIVTRFLALLELYRRGNLTFEQAHPMGELVVKWEGNGR